MSEISEKKIEKNKNWIITTKEEFINRIELPSELRVKNSKWKDKIIDNPLNLKNYILWLLLKSKKIKVPSEIKIKPKYYFEDHVNFILTDLYKYLLDRWEITSWVIWFTVQWFISRYSRSSWQKSEELKLRHSKHLRQLASKETLEDTNYFDFVNELTDNLTTLKKVSEYIKIKDTFDVRKKFNLEFFLESLSFNPLLLPYSRKINKELTEKQEKQILYVLKWDIERYKKPSKYNPSDYILYTESSLDLCWSNIEQSNEYSSNLIQNNDVEDDVESNISLIESIVTKNSKLNEIYNRIKNYYLNWDKTILLKQDELKKFRLLLLEEIWKCNLNEEERIYLLENITKWLLDQKKKK